MGCRSRFAPRCAPGDGTFAAADPWGWWRFVSPAPGLPDTPPPSERPSRVAIERVSPEVDAGRFAAKRIAGDRVEVRATIFADGHEVLAAEVLYRHDGAGAWSRAPMQLLGNDRWEGAFDVPEPGRFEYTVEAWVDRYASWLERLDKRHAAGQDLAVEFQVGARLLASAAAGAGKPGASGLRGAASQLPGLDPEAGVALAHAVADEACRYQDKGAVAAYARVLALDVERERAGFGAWYEFFPRSFGKDGVGAGTFQPAMMAHLVDHTEPSERGRALSTFTLGNDLGLSVGALMLGVLVDQAGYRPAFVVAAAIAASGAVLFFISTQRAHSWRTAEAAVRP